MGAPDDAELSWTWEQEHVPLPATPLDIALDQLSKPGMDRAQDEAGIPVRDIFPRSIQPNGFYYFLASAPPRLPTDEVTRHQQAAAQFVAMYGEGRPVWERYCLPRIQDACATLQKADEDVPIAALAELHGYANGLTFLPFGQGVRRLMEFLAAEFGSDAQGLIAELTSGYANATLYADQALWGLADIARKSPLLKDLFTSSPPAPDLDAIARVESGAFFLVSFHRFLESYGWRTEGWDISSPTWRERPSAMLALVHRIIQDDSPSPREISRKTARRRRTLARALEQRLAVSKRSDFRSALEGASSWVPVKEGRAYWQLRASGALRSALLLKGAALVRTGKIQHAEDVFYLLPKEIEDSGNLSEARPLGQRDGDFLTLVEARRQERERWLNVIPPRTIGASAASVSTEAEVEVVIKGTPASRGLVTGRARVIKDLSQADRLQRGEILIAPMTSPSWTILFGRAAAVVTDSGGVLSHPSVAAREYGIPCVVGTQVATQRIRDGMLLTVDGSSGSVTIIDRK